MKFTLFLLILFAIFHLSAQDTLPIVQKEGIESTDHQFRSLRNFYVEQESKKESQEEHDE